MTAPTTEVTAATEAAEARAGLSTQPAPPPQRGRATVWRRAWRQLTSMRIALQLLLLLALAAVPGSILPQRGSNPDGVTRYFTQHPSLAPFLDRVQAFDVYGSPWFAAVYGLLFVSLVGCLVPRIRLHARALFTPPPATVPRRFDRLPRSASFAAAEVDLDRAAAALRRSRWRVRVTESGALTAEKGYLRETGNLLFHVALVGLLASIALGSILGYHGSRVVVEGQSFASSPALYDEFQSGALVSPSDVTPFALTLDRFAATYLPSGQPRTFDAYATYADTVGGPTRQADLRINHPVRTGATAVYLGGHGFAPHIVVRDGGGRVIYDSYVVCRPETAAQLSYACTVKVADTGLPASANGRPTQLAFTGFFFPAPAASPSMGIVGTSPAVRSPGMTVLAWVGDMGVDAGTPQSVYELTTTNMTRVATTFLAVGGPNGTDTMTRGLPGGYSMTVDGYRNWASLEIKHDPVKQFTLLFASLMVVGLIGSLRVRRRRLWVKAGPVGPTGTRTVEIGGLPRTDAEAFADEFAALTALVARTSVLRAVPASAPAPADGHTGAAAPDLSTDGGARP
ncbi:MAG: putative cytochrome biosis rane protein [Mycobacterium sp.]|nr:putative cytochrome biosis rane protein [Mycobacterium sp.]